MGRRGRKMPWKGLPPQDWMTLLANFLGLILAGLMGTASRILDQIEDGKRDRVWSRELVTDALGFLLMVIAAAGISEYLDMGKVATAALAGVLCRGGTPMLDLLFYAVTNRVKGPKK